MSLSPKQEETNQITFGQKQAPFHTVSFLVDFSQKREDRIPSLGISSGKKKSKPHSSVSKPCLRKPIVYQVRLLIGFAFFEATHFFVVVKDQRQTAIVEVPPKEDTTSWSFLLQTADTHCPVPAPVPPDSASETSL